MKIAINEHGQQIIVLPDVIFLNKQNINWKDVEEYLLKYIGEVVEITETKDTVYIGKEFPDEYTGSKYTYTLKGARAKAKANAVQGIKEMVEIATDKRFKENYNIYKACLIINHASNGKLYLYDIVDIKKEASNPLKTFKSQMV